MPILPLKQLLLLLVRTDLHSETQSLQMDTFVSCVKSPVIGFRVALMLLFIPFHEILIERLQFLQMVTFAVFAVSPVIGFKIALMPQSILCLFIRLIPHAMLKHHLLGYQKIFLTLIYQRAKIKSKIQARIQVQLQAQLQVKINQLTEVLKVLLFLLKIHRLCGWEI
jgi:hypothetical protein